MLMVFTVIKSDNCTFLFFCICTILIPPFVCIIIWLQCKALFKKRSSNLSAFKSCFFFRHSFVFLYLHHIYTHMLDYHIYYFLSICFLHEHLCRHAYSCWYFAFSFSSVCVCVSPFRKQQRNDIHKSFFCFLYRCDTVYD